MKISTVLLIVLILSGCVAAPIELPDWDLAAPSETPVTDAEPLPELCPIDVVDGRGTWSNECWQIFEKYEEISEFNFVAAQENARGLENSEAATRQLIEAAKIQQQLSQIRQEMLDRERRQHTFDNWFYRVVITLGLIGASL